jgi:hypothetical protein
MAWRTWQLVELGKERAVGTVTMGKVLVQAKIENL